MTEFVFGYGSLLRRGPGRLRDTPRPARLLGCRRAWNVAMDNSLDLPGYKYYREPGGRRPAVFVTFLNLVAAEGAEVNGVLLAVPEAELPGLDARERNYERLEVTDRMFGVAPGRVWAYRGRPAARERYETGLARELAVVARAYHDEVEAGFRALGGDALAAYRASTDPPRCPLTELERIDLPT